MKPSHFTLPPEFWATRVLATRYAAGEFTDSSACWLWPGALTGGGYGHRWWHGKTNRVHRVAYELSVGPITKGLQLDHLCRNRPCFNPRHLEPVTRRENILRGESPAALNARKTHCKRGHEFTEENTYHKNPRGRACIKCLRAYGHTMNEGEATLPKPKSESSKLFPKFRELAREVHLLKSEVRSTKLRLDALENIARKQLGN